MTTDQVATTSPSPPRGPGGFRDEPIRTTIRGLGQLFITLGVVLLLFVVYEVYVTDIFGAQKQAQAKESMAQRWATSTPATSDPPAVPTTEEDSGAVVAPPSDAQVVDPAERTRTYDTQIGQGFANLNIPVFGADYGFTVVEGTTAEDLYGNPGHYDDTQYPGELGNFAVAGHRVSKGAPFNALGTLNSCDAIVIETQQEWFVYRVLPMPEEAAGWNAAARSGCADVAPLTGAYSGVVGREIVDPSDYAQVLPIPHVDATGPEAVAAASQRLITLTTCHPQFSDRERMIIHGVLTRTYAKTDGFVPAELSEVG
ncbi:MAG: class E sortase [Nakamurella sp.]